MLALIYFLKRRGFVLVFGSNINGNKLLPNLRPPHCVRVKFTKATLQSPTNI